MDPIQLYLSQAVQQFRGQFEQQLNRLSAASRVGEGRIQELQRNVADLQRALNSVNVSASGRDHVPDTLFIDDIPGRREPYTLLVDIPIGANVIAKQRVPVTISQEGPFVAVRRIATFQSAYEFQASDPRTNQTARFVGRSYGRYRPVHSAWDVADAQHNGVADSGNWFLQALLNFGTPATTILPSAVLGIPSNQSSFRSMEFDGRVTVYTAGSSAARQNIPVPTSFWSEAINSPFNLGAMDFFERGDVITFEVAPNHINNPAAGNVSGPYVFPAVGGLGVPQGYPFIEGQFDAHEGIATPSPADINVAGEIRLPDLLQTDNITRLPNGILTIGFEGYRIKQPVGPAR